MINEKLKKVFEDPKYANYSVNTTVGKYEGLYDECNDPLGYMCVYRKKQVTILV